MHDDNTVPFGPAQAQQLADAGWRQGCAFQPPDNLHVPEWFQRGEDWLVVCTQSCSVVSERLAADPYIEVSAAKPLIKYNKKDQRATGKDLRHYHIQMSEFSNIPAFECDINRRFFIRREECLKFAPQNGLQAANLRAFAGWLARYYSRVALPDMLVLRARRGKLFDTVKTILDHKDKNEKLSASIDAIYVAWEPDRELNDDSVYEIELLFLCSGEEVETIIGGLLSDALIKFEQDGGYGGISLRWDAKSRSSTFVSELDGYHRLSEWDYLTSLGAVAEDCDLHCNV